MRRLLALLASTSVIDRTMKAGGNRHGILRDNVSRKLVRALLTRYFAPVHFDVSDVRSFRRGYLVTEYSLDKRVSTMLFPYFEFFDRYPLDKITRVV